MTLGKIIAARRQDMDLSQQKLADVLGVSRSTVAMWETDANTPPTKHLAAIARALDCTIDALLQPTDEAEPQP